MTPMNDNNQNIWNYDEIWTQKPEPTAQMNGGEPAMMNMRITPNPEPKKKSGGGRRFVAAVVACAVVSAAVGGGSAWYVVNNFSPTAPATTQDSGTASNNTDESNNYRSVVANETGKQQLSVVDISKQVGPSVVAINCTMQTSGNNPFARQQTATASGSGIIISSDGTILTNNHVIDGATAIQIVLSDGTTHDAKLIGHDAKTDLAVLKVDATGLPAATLGNSAELEVGEQAVVIGNPLGELGGSVTVGFISALDRNLNIEGTMMHLLQTDAAVNPGNSGGALVNMYGEVVGVVNSKTSATGVEGLGFAIPIDDAKPIINELIDNGYVTGRPMVGISPENMTGQTALRYGVSEGVYILQVQPGGAADRAGAQVGDKILTYGGQEITDKAQIEEIKATQKVGDKVEMQVERDGRTLTLTITLAEENSN